MNIDDLLSGLPGIILDGRHLLRGKGVPTSVTTVRADGSLSNLVVRALNSDPVPVAVVSPDGRALVLTGGESGVIWTQGEPTVAQQATVETISEALAVLGGLSLTGVVAPEKVSKKKRKPEPEVESEPVVEVVSDGVVEVEPGVYLVGGESQVTDSGIDASWIEEDFS
jgi:hypothetical protein